ncbi:ORF D57 [Sulfolobus virus Ragged Hills]|uniref:ORF D57 n=1 Tax=Sulfolobus virus Ragged Hills TaxID=256994 RepID=Q6TRU8_9VIRU|nr:ORF D57 [Sulfolobus virus Ragged Hills]AAR27913.1 ORF D57 [Sulfolobus virus Ragged Hills]
MSSLNLYGTNKKIQTNFTQNFFLVLGFNHFLTLYLSVCQYEYINFSVCQSIKKDVDI